MYRILITLIITLSFSSAWSTSFTPVTIKNQVSESDGIVSGEVLFTESLVDDSGKIISKVSIMADRWQGVETSESIVEVYFPGGRYEGKVEEVSGAPVFASGEKVVLFTRKYKNLNWVQNLGLGKFSLKRVGNEYVMVNQIFPRYPLVGQIQFKKFIIMAEKIKKQKLEKRYKDKYELNQEKQAMIRHNSKGRKVASIDEHGNIIEDKITATWLLVFFALLGVSFRLFRRRGHN